MNDIYLHKIEKVACSLPDSPEKILIRDLLVECRRLQHELADPNYLYAGNRINRLAIVTRNEEIDALREELKKLKESK